MVDFRQLLVNAVRASMNVAVGAQEAFFRGEGDINYKKNEGGIDKSPATAGDELSQDMYVKYFNEALGADNICYENEEGGQ